MSPASSTDPKSDTKEQILNAAERQFAQFGFAGTSLRALTRDAKVNLAAVHYHFGSKEELFKAVVRRVAQPIVQEQMRHLEALEQLHSTPPVIEIIEAYVARPLEMMFHKREASCYLHGQFFGRCRTEPRPIQKLADIEFSASSHKVLELLQKSLPHQSLTELEFKLDLIVAMIVRVVMEMDNSEQVDEKIKRLVRFITSGISV